MLSRAAGGVESRHTARSVRATDDVERRGTEVLARLRGPLGAYFSRSLKGADLN
jgi:hypothetical protein